MSSRATRTHPSTRAGSRLTDNDQSIQNPAATQLSVEEELRRKIAQLEEELRIERLRQELALRQAELIATREQHPERNEAVELADQPDNTVTSLTQPTTRQPSPLLAAAKRKRQDADSHDDHRRAPRIKTIVPDAYKGESLQEYNDFIYACEMEFRANNEHYGTEAKKVLFAATRLQGDPMRTWRQHEQQHGLDTATWAVFQEKLHDWVQDPQNRGLTYAKRYNDARQRHEQTTVQFSNYLSMLELELPGGMPSEIHRVHKLLTCLRPELRNQIMLLAETPSTRDALVQIASRYEQMTRHAQTPMRNNRGEGSSRSYRGESRSSRGKQTVVNLVPGGNRGDRGDRGNRRGSHSSRGRGGFRNAGDPVVCYNCNKEGHIRPDCPQLTSGKGPTRSS